MCVRSTSELTQKLHTHRSLTAVESSLSTDAFRFVLESFFSRLPLFGSLFWWCLALFLAQIYRHHTRNTLSYCQFDSKTLNSPFAHTNTELLSKWENVSIISFFAFFSLWLSRWFDQSLKCARMCLSIMHAA